MEGFHCKPIGHLQSQTKKANEPSHMHTAFRTPVPWCMWNIRELSMSVEKYSSHFFNRGTHHLSMAAW